MNSRQQKFVAVFEGNGTEAARLAGYGGDEASLAVIASRLLKNVNISAAIKKRQVTGSKKLIASREDRQAFWTKVMEDAQQDMRNRLKASELLGKSEADFTEKVEHSGTISLEHMVRKSYEKEVIEIESGDEDE